MSILWPAIGWYSVFSFFVFQQQIHSKNFRGASVFYGFFLSLFGFLGVLVGLFYLGWVAYVTHWWVPVPMFLAGTIASGVISGLLRTEIALAITSLTGFVAAPVAGYLMFSTI